MRDYTKAIEAVQEVSTTCIFFDARPSNQLTGFFLPIPVRTLPRLLADCIHALMRPSDLIRH